MKEKVYFNNDMISWNKAPNGLDIKDDFAQYLAGAGFNPTKIGYNTMKAENKNIAVTASINPVLMFPNLRMNNMVMKINVVPKNNSAIAKKQGEYIVEIAQNYLNQTF